jgi:hypothetical protein
MPCVAPMAAIRSIHEGFGRLMDWLSVADEWKHFRNEVRTRWALLSSTQLEAIAGRRPDLAEQIRASYGITAEEVERQILSFEARSQFLRAVSSR